MVRHDSSDFSRRLPNTTLARNSQSRSRHSAPLFLGIDLGTSGCRAMVIDARREVVGKAGVDLPPPMRDGPRCEQDPELWWQAVDVVIRALGEQLPLAQITALAVDGTSGSVLLCDEDGTPLTPGLMYNDSRAQDEARRIAVVAPPASGAHGASSGLAKLLHLQTHYQPRAARVLNQAEWIAGRLTGRYDGGDENNCLKLGYDIIERRWPAWLEQLGVSSTWLPRVVPPGTAIGRVAPAAARVLGLSEQTWVKAGTTDSIAAFLATGAHETGEAVTSLGSTLVLKVLAERPVFSPQHGIYSHRLGERWLAGGASNSGGAVLLQHFTRAELDAMTPRLSDAPTGLDYYPLPAPGERFPVNDPRLPPRLTPRPADPLRFFQGMLEGMAAIEAAGYRLLAELGAPYPISVRSVGGGAGNAAWSRMRARTLGVTVNTPAHSDAAYGAALLAADR